MQLTTELTWGPDVNAACVAQMTEDYDGDTLTVSGWGATIYDGEQANILQEVELMGISNTDCIARGGSYASLTPQMLCAEASGKDSCSGDSGGIL